MKLESRCWENEHVVIPDFDKPCPGGTNTSQRRMLRPLRETGSGWNTVGVSCVPDHLNSEV